MENIKCDSCGKDFELKIKIKKHTRLIEEAYFRCPHCKERYSSYFTDEHIRVKQQQINKLWEQLRKAVGDEQVAEITGKINAMKAEIKKDMLELKSARAKGNKQ